MTTEITIVIEGGCLRDVIGDVTYTLVDVDNQKVEGMTNDQIDQAIEKAKQNAKIARQVETLPDDIQKYIDQHGVNCLYCGSDDIVGGEITIGGGGAYQDVTCLKCEKEWTDCYHLGNVLEQE